MTPRKLRFAFTVGCFAFGVLCAPAQSGDKAKPDIVGTIKSVNAAKKGTEVLAFILVEGPKGQAYDAASIRVTTKTKLYIVVDKQLKPATVTDLKVGANVSAKFVGPVAESYPVQASAGEIVIRAGDKK